MDRVEKAVIFARAAHAAVGQVRKYTGEPYIVHPLEVLGIVAQVTDDDDILCAAVLHDVVEDTQVSIEQIEAEFGDRVAELVHYLTDPTTYLQVSRRAERKAIYRDHLRQAPAAAQTIKLADIISNTRNIRELDPVYAVGYLQEKADLLEVLTGGDVGLFDLAALQIWR